MRRESTPDLERRARANWRQIVRLNHKERTGQGNGATTAALDRRVVDDKAMGGELERRHGFDQKRPF